MTEPVKGDVDNGVKLVVSIANNCRVLYSKVAAETGASYSAVKMKIERAMERGLLSIKPLLSAKTFGRVGALLRIKTNGNREKMIELLTSCNRVLGLTILGDEIVAIIVARSKLDVTILINRLSLIGDGLVEYSVEYGEIPQNMMIPVKNTKDCEQGCIFGFSGKHCLPSLNAKNNRNNKA